MASWFRIFYVESEFQPWLPCDPYRVPCGARITNALRKLVMSAILVDIKERRRRAELRRYITSVDA